MIFSNNINKLCSGDNITTHFKSNDTLIIFTKNNSSISKFIFNFNKASSILNTLNLNYEYVKQLDEKLFVVGYEDSMSVIYELQ